MASYFGRSGADEMDPVVPVEPDEPRPCSPRSFSVLFEVCTAGRGKSEGYLIEAAKPRAFADGLKKLHRRLEEIRIEPQLISIEIIHEMKSWDGIIPDPAQELADIGPVLLFERGVIILFFFSALRHRSPADSR